MQFGTQIGEQFRVSMPLKSGSAHPITPMRQPTAQKNANQMQETEKVPFVVAKRIREAILDEVFKPGDRLTEAELVEKFEVSRSPIREALLALEKEGTIVISPFRGAIIKPLSPEEVQDIAELRLALITLAAKPTHRHLAPADFDLLYGLAKQITATNSTKEHFEYNRRFWNILFEKARRPILWEVFTHLDDRMTRYYPLFLKLFPTAERRPRQQEVLIEIYRKGKIDEALRAFRKISLGIVDQAIDYLNTRDRNPPVLKRSSRKTLRNMVDRTRRNRRLG
jgi:DNA-binding GntR family transcriptional regulator